ncbi:MAG: molecular chaperone [Gammaproteobacteria bacterium]|nr:molecular chaperone [Gammaproteobacteria bacterium]
MKAILHRIVFLSVCVASIFPLYASAQQPLLPPAQIAASPSVVQTTIGSKRGESVKLFNLGEKPISVRVSVSNWELDENNRLRDIPPTPQSLDQWIVINPLEFVIPPRGTQTIRLVIRPRQKPEAGEHRAMIYFEEQLPDKLSPEEVRVKFRLGVAVYGLAGKIIREGRLKSLTLRQDQKKSTLLFDIESVGNANVRLDGQYTLWTKKGFPGEDKVAFYNVRGKNGVIPEDVVQVQNLPTTPVLPNTQRALPVSVLMPEEPGEYVLLAKGKLAEKAFSKVFPITISK